MVRCLGLEASGHTSIDWNPRREIFLTTSRKNEKTKFVETSVCIRSSEIKLTSSRAEKSETKVENSSLVYVTQMGLLKTVEGLK